MQAISRGIKRVVTSVRTLEGGGFPVRRPLGIRTLDYLDPFLMLDHLGPITYAPGEAVGAPDHPHRGFETVTYVLQGSMQHKDSRGNEGYLGSGAVQWMTAGSGVVHSEMPSDDMRRDGGTMEGFQLWVNLPRSDKMIAPRYQDIQPHLIPEATSEDGHTMVRVIAGESLGKSAVIDTRTPIMYLDIHMSAVGAVFEQPVPSTFQGFAYIYRGEGKFGPEETPAQEGQLLLLDAGDKLVAKSECDNLRFLLIAGVPLNEPIARHGPFVMTTREEIIQAFEDYQNGVMGGIEGAEERYAQTKAARATQQANRRN
eukprot:TRINITY_DN4887_c0_g1_i2.p1 TRINITY_DN4887_c0_g1~~TRINITY_DN4887_c0_g1_i2.p1  ORF type:complete len:313 (-),score=89.63 TRINITY_DN4887_c0_g1_i2:144-1082(-)